MSEKEKEELRNRILGIGTEVTGGIATDFATAALLNPVSLAKTGGLSALAYGGINFAQGAYTNYLVQKHLYGNEQINWGEVISSGAVGAIPFMNIGASKGVSRFVGKAGSIKRGLVGGTGFAVGGEQLRVGIDERRLLTLPELGVSTAFGGLAGAGFAQLNKSIQKQTFRRGYKADFLGPDNQLDLAKVQARQAKILKESPEVAALRGKLTTQADPNHGLPTHGPTGEEIIWQNFIPDSVLKKTAKMKGYMRDMGLVDEEFDWYKWNKWSLKTIDYVDKKGTKKKLYPNQNASRDFIGWFESIEKYRANFHKMTATNSKERQRVMAFYAPMMQALGLKAKDFQLHHLVPLKASIPLYHGLKYGSEEWWKLTAYLLKKHIKAGDSADNLKWVFGSRGKTTIKRPQGGSYQMKSPHSVSHTFADEKLGPDGRKFFTDEVLNNIKTNPESRWGYAEKFVHITRDSFDITNLAEEMLNTKWKDLNIDVEKTTRILNTLDEEGYFTSIPKKYQVDEINRMIGEIAATGEDEFYRRSIAAFEEVEILKELAKKEEFKKATSDLANTNEYFNKIVDMTNDLLKSTKKTEKQFVRYSNFMDPKLYLDVVQFIEDMSPTDPKLKAIQQELFSAEVGREILIIKLMEMFYGKFGAK